MSNARPVPAIIDDRLPTLAPGGEEDRLSLLVYGKPGVGKTVLAATSEDDPRTAPVLFCDVEMGRLSISYRGKALRIFPMNSWTDLGVLKNYFYGPGGIRGDIPYKTIVVDSLSELARRAMENVLSLPNSKRPTPGVPEFTDWNIFTNKMVAAIEFFRDLPLNLIVTALEEETDNGVIPLLPGKKIAASLPRYFNTVGRLYVAPLVVDNKTVYRRRLLLNADVRYMAKDRGDRLGVMEREMEEPTIQKLVDRMAEGKRLAALSLQENKTR